jgi:hypothetical protein
MERDRMDSAAVAFLEQIQIGPDAQFAQRAGHPGGAQVQRPLLRVLPGREDLVWRQFPRHHPGVPGLLGEPAHVRFFLGGFLATARRLRIELEDEPVRGVSQLPERLALRRLRQSLVALAASAADRTDVSSSMIRTCTGWISPAASAAKVDGSRCATAQT